MNNLKKYALYIGIGVIGMLLGALLFGGGNTTIETQTTDEHIAESHTDEQGNVIYSCSMHPSVRQNEPGDCPICGMELIPINNDSNTDGNLNEFTMSQAALKLAEIETSVARMGNPVSTIYLPGKVVANQNNVSSISSHSAGRIIQLYVDYVGAFVEKGQKIASLYSPELVSAQQEFLQTAEFKDQNPVLYKSAKRKLELLELPSSTISKIEESGEIMTQIDIVSQATGYVTKLNVTRQEHVLSGTILFEVADISSVWVMFDAFESDISLIKKGHEISFTTASYPGEVFKGIVSFVDPLVNNKTRTTDVRVRVNNPEQKLKPNMLAEGTLTAEISNQTSLLVPKSAVLWTGPRSIVFVQVPEKEEPTFVAREVTLGKRVGNQYIIKDGLTAGEEVVTHGNFKLDGAAQLADKLSMMNRTPGTGANKTGHEGHAPETESSGGSEVIEIEDDHSAHKNTQAESIAPAFKAQLNEVLKEYLIMKEALVESDVSKTSASAKSLQERLNSVDMTLVKGDLHLKWMEHLESLTELSKKIESANALNIQRAEFLALSTTLIESVKTFGVKGVIYEQFCPMANGGKGGYWLSENEEIYNPYYGEQMLKCGETIQKIEF